MPPYCASAKKDARTRKREEGEGEEEEEDALCPGNCVRPKCQSRSERRSITDAAAPLIVVCRFPISSILRHFPCCLPRRGSARASLSSPLPLPSWQMSDNADFTPDLSGKLLCRLFLLHSLTHCPAHAYIRTAGLRRGHPTGWLSHFERHSCPRRGR